MDPLHKICILTFHRACNYGAVLQAYALQETLSLLGSADVSILDYYSAEVYNCYQPLGMLKRGNFVKGAVKTALLLPSIINRNNRFKAFRDQYLYCTPYGEQEEDLKNICEKYDGVVAGSDQVWNSDLTKGDQTYLLDFVPAGVKKFSYAASIGRENLSQEELRRLSKHLRDFCEVSLREPDMVSGLQHALEEKTVRCDVDPVFLLSAEQWRAIADGKRENRYVLYFTLDSGRQSRSVANFAKRFAMEQRMDAVYLSNGDRWFCFRDMTHHGVAGPAQFLGAIDHAEYVVTNSFHGTAFSIILHKPFFVETARARSGRIKNLLELAGLTDRTLESGKLKREPRPIDWDAVDARMAEHIESSKRYLKEIVNAL